MEPPAGHADPQVRFDEIGDLVGDLPGVVGAVDGVVDDGRRAVVRGDRRFDDRPDREHVASLAGRTPSPSRDASMHEYHDHERLSSPREAR